jgi:hypothetical protein
MVQESVKSRDGSTIGPRGFFRGIAQDFFQVCGHLTAASKLETLPCATGVTKLLPASLMYKELNTKVW